MKRTFLAGALALFAAPLAAQTFIAEGKTRVTPVANGIAVASDGGMGARGMWCAAADYAISRLGANGTERLYVVEPRPRGSRAPVVFSLDPTGLTPQRVRITGGSTRVKGATLSVGHARSFCADFRIITR